MVTLQTSAPHRFPLKSGWTWPVANAALVPVLFAAALFALNPTGYLGGGGDEYRYLSAARCGTAYEWCGPVDHWARRWPVVAPVKIVLQLFGEHHTSLAIVPFLYAMGCVALLSNLVVARYGAQAGIFAGVAFAASPLVVWLVPRLGIDMPELFFILAATDILRRALDRQDERLVLLAGVIAGVAVQARPSALAYLPIAVIALFAARRGRWSIPFLAATAIPSMGEAIIHAISAGDPLLGWRLSLSHATIPSTELSPAVDTRESPVMNPEFIAGWQRPMGIHIHWTIDGLLNYLCHPGVAITLGAAISFAALERRMFRDGPRAPELRWALLLGISWFAALTYGLAVDPKPRTFLPTLAVACALFGAAAARRWKTGRLLVACTLAVLATKGVIATYERIDSRAFAAPARELLRDGGVHLAIDPRTARFLALSPQAASVPPFVPGTRASRLLLIGENACIEPARASDLAGWRIVRAAAVTHDPPAWLSVLQARSVFSRARQASMVCLMGRS